MRNTILRGCVLLGTCALVACSLAAAAAAPGANQPATQSVPSVGAAGETIPTIFQGDARLAAKVTLAEKNRPLGEVLTELGEKLHVRLVAGRETADDKVTLFLDERPAAEVLALIARHLDFQWQHNHGGYELAQDLSRRSREAALRDAERAAQVAHVEARMARLEQLAAMPREQLNTRQSEIGKQLADANLDPAERARLTEEQEAIRDLLRPGGAPAVALYQILTPAQIARLRAGGEVRLSSTDGTLPPTLTAAIQKEAAEMRQPRSLPGGGMAMAFTTRIDTGGVGGPPAGNGAGAGGEQHEVDTTIRYTDSGGLRLAAPRQGGPQLQLRFTLNSVSIAVQGNGTSRRSAPLIWSPTLAAPATGAEKVTTQTTDPTLQRAVDLKLSPTQGPQGATDTVPGGGKPLALLGQWPADRPTLADVGEALHRTAGLEIVADSFVRARLNPATVGGRRPLVQILDGIANELQYDWKKDGNLLRFRSRIYFEDRPAEVPARILGPWSRRVVQAGAPSLDNLAELAAALDDSQCRGMQEFWGWYLEGTGIPPLSGLSGFADNRHHLRLWAALSPAQRREALGGTVVPVAGMTGLQRQAFQIALAAPNEVGMVGLDLRRAPTAAEVAAGGFSLSTRQLQQQMLSGAGQDGRAMRVMTMAPADRPGAPPADPPRVAGLPGLDTLLQNAGPPTLLDSYVFEYHVNGEQVPARTASINLPRPAQRSAERH